VRASQLGERGGEVYRYRIVDSRADTCREQLLEHSIAPASPYVPRFQVLAGIKTRSRSVAESPGTHPVQTGALRLGRVFHYPGTDSPRQWQQSFGWGGLAMEMYWYSRRSAWRHCSLDSIDVD
jgi:hypothetical protein